MYATSDNKRIRHGMPTIPYNEIQLIHISSGDPEVSLIPKPQRNQGIPNPPYITIIFMALFDRRTEDSKLKREEEEKEAEIVVQSDEALAKGVIGLLKTWDPDLMSEITQEQHRALTALSARANKYNIGILQTHIVSYLKLAVSYDRKGRTEIKNIATAIRSDEARKSRMDQLKGIFGMGGDDY